jgi:nitroreductase
MEFFEALHRRRSVRNYTSKPVPADIMAKILDAALIAPNSSNMQTWEFYWVRSPEKKKELVKACLSQSAARTAQELIVVVSDDSLWKRNAKELFKIFKGRNEKRMMDYYGKVMPIAYGFRLLAPVKWLFFNVTGFFRPIVRRPWSARDISEVAIKSAALASENIMLAAAALGYDSCPMEGIDEFRIKRILKLRWRARVAMVISIGERDPEGIWGPQIRLPREWFVKEV